MTSTASVVIWGIWIVVILRFYHKMFDVYYFRGSALFKELFFAALLGMVMTGLTLYLWWLTAIIIILCGLVISKKTSNSAALIGCMILAVVIAVIGIKARKEMRVDTESQDIDDLTETYSDDMFADIYDLIENDMEEDTVNSDSWDDVNSQVFENEEIPEYNLSETYVNEEEGIRFMYPSEWEPVDSDEVGNYYAASDLENVVVLLTNTSEDMDELNACFMVLKLQETEISMDELLIDDEEFKEMLAETAGDEFSNLETSVMELDGISARVVSFDVEGMACRTYYYYVNSDFYQINFYRRQGDEYMDSDLDAVMDTYTIADGRDNYFGM